MEGENEASADAEHAEATESNQGRQRSKISFPYMDLSAALSVVNAIHEHVGMGDCSLQQLSAWMDQSIKSSGFRVQISASRQFGVIESEGTDSYRLTSLGRQIVDPQQARKAKSEAFLNIDLFRLLYENHSEGVLPPAAALEREIASLGVAEKQKDRARQVFERSADQAGFFEHGRNRLVMPAVKETGEKKEEPKHGGGGGGGGEIPPKIDPIIQGLIARLPESGAVWAKDQRKLWLGILENSFDLVYKDKIEQLPSPNSMHREQALASADDSAPEE